jgi:zinc transporter, ZIP family
MSLSDAAPAVAWAPIVAALGATLLTWFCTAIGAASVFILPRLSARMFSALLAVAAGVMLAAAFGGLLLPAWSALAAAGHEPWTATGCGVLMGVAMVMACRRLLTQAEAGLANRPRLGSHLFVVMSLHHVPEGMAVGLAVSAASSGAPSAAVSAGLVVVAMASHNLLEGALVSLPLRREGLSRRRAFACGQLSGAAEVLGAVVGVVAVSISTALLPWAMAAAGGAMLMVTLVDILPGMRENWTLEIENAQGAEAN